MIELAPLFRGDRKREAILRRGDAQVVGHGENDRVGERAGARGDAVVGAEGLVEVEVEGEDRAAEGVVYGTASLFYVMLRKGDYKCSILG